MNTIEPITDDDPRTRHQRTATARLRAAEYEARQGHARNAEIFAMFSIAHSLAAASYAPPTHPPDPATPPAARGELVESLMVFADRLVEVGARMGDRLIELDHDDGPLVDEWDQALLAFLSVVPGTLRADQGAGDGLEG